MAMRRRVTGSPHFLRRIGQRRRNIFPAEPPRKPHPYQTCRHHSAKDVQSDGKGETAPPAMEKQFGIRRELTRPAPKRAWSIINLTPQFSAGPPLDDTRVKIRTNARMPIHLGDPIIKIFRPSVPPLKGFLPRLERNHSEEKAGEEGNHTCGAVHSRSLTERIRVGKSIPGVSFVR
jgi:hypothetical protein